MLGRRAMLRYGDRQDEVARRVEDVLVEELGRDEERLGGVEPADEAVDVEAERDVEGVALQQRRPGPGSCARRRSRKRRIDERVEAALGVVLAASAAGMPAVPGAPIAVGAVRRGPAGSSARRGSTRPRSARPCSSDGTGKVTEPPVIGTRGKLLRRR